MIYKLNNELLKIKNYIICMFLYFQYNLDNIVVDYFHSCICWLDKFSSYLEENQNKLNHWQIHLLSAKVTKLESSEKPSSFFYGFHSTASKMQLSSFMLNYLFTFFPSNSKHHQKDRDDQTYAQPSKVIEIASRQAQMPLNTWKHTERNRQRKKYLL